MIQNVLQRIERENEQDSVWIVGPKTGHLLYWLIRVVAPESIVEIGTSVGYSALWMASALEENGKGQLWTIESHEQRFERAESNFKEAGLTDRILLLKGHAPEIFFDKSAPLPEHIDFAFFDATKKDHNEYFDAVYPRMSSGGLIVVDNVLSHRFGQMQDFIDLLHNDSRLKVVEIPVGDGLLIARIV